MKKIIIAFVSLILLLASMFSMSVLADGSVIYNCDEHVFIFNPGSKESPTDLFEDLKNMMPGDTATQVIRVGNHKKSNMNSKIYLRSLGATEEDSEFLSQLSMQISLEGKKELFDAPPSEKAQMKDWVYLGVFEPGAEVELHLTLSVPLTLGDEFQDSIGNVQWEFKSEEFPIDEKGPETGDGYLTFLYMALIVVSLICILVMICRKRKDK